MFQNEPHFTDETDQARYEHNITTDFRQNSFFFTADEP